MIKFSIITPTFNSARHVKDCVLSVLHQDYDNFEHIIIDNASTDTTREIITSLYERAGKTDKLKFYSEPDSGISDAFNKGIVHATGMYVLILNSDDKLYDGSILRAIDAFAAQGDYRIIHGDMFFEDNTFGSNRRAPLFCPVQAAMPYNHPGMFIKRSVYDEYGLYKTTYRIAMDYELILRLDTMMPDFKKRLGYFRSTPIAVSTAGGVSWTGEQRGIDEVRKALKEHSRYNGTAMYHYWARTLRTKIKGILFSLNLHGLVKIWRKKKWGN